MSPGPRCTPTAHPYFHPGGSRLAARGTPVKYAPAPSPEVGVWPPARLISCAHGAPPEHVQLGYLGALTPVLASRAPRPWHLAPLGYLALPPWSPWLPLRSPAPARNSSRAAPSHLRR